MPLPKPIPGEKEDDYVSRCVPVVLKEGKNREQAVAICYSQFRGKAMNINDRLLAAVRSRSQKQTEFGYGILTADVYARTLAERIGIDNCYKFAANRKTSFDDLLQKAGRTLVYSNPQMTIEEKDVDKIRKDHDIELPKNTLMVFKHTLSTSTEDRDGDVLHSIGAKPDPKMLLLFQHLHTMPIGKAIAIADQTDEWLKMISCIVDINELSHDSAVMVDNGMGRFSHGFRAIDFEEIKGDSKKPNGFDIREYEIMEESLVSVPANIDATTEEVLLSLVEGGKLTSPVFKAYGKQLREKQPVMVPVTFREIKCNSFDELKQAKDAGLIAGVEEEKYERTEQDNGAGTPKETNEFAEDKRAEGGGEKAEAPNKKVKCPKCGSTNIKDGKCQECGYVMPKIDSEGGKAETGPGGHVPDGTGPHGQGEGPGNGQADGSGKADGEKYYEAIANSFEWIRDQLAPQVRTLLAPGKDEWCSIEATFSDYVLVQKEMNTEDGQVYYRVAWEMKDGKPELGTEAKPVEIEPARVLLPKRTKPETQEPQLTPQSAMTLFVARASATQRKQMKELLEVFERSLQRAKEVKQLRVFRGLV